MIKPGALVMAVVMTAVTAGTYYGLDFVPPQLLGGTFGRTPKAEPPPPGGQSVAAPAPVQARPAESHQVAQADTPVTEADLAEEPPPTEAPAPAEQAAAEPAATATATPETPAAEPAPASPAPAPGPAASSAGATETKPKASAAPQPKPKPATVAKAEPTGPVKPKPPEADVIKPWWPDPSKMPAEQLKLQYAGQVQGEEAIALLFSAPLNVETIKQHARILTMTGVAVDGTWELGKNPRLVVFRGVKPGRYTVVLAPEIADSKGFMLGTTLQGPVYITNP